MKEVIAEIVRAYMDLMDTRKEMDRCQKDFHEGLDKGNIYNENPVAYGFRIQEPLDFYYVYASHERSKKQHLSCLINAAVTNNPEIILELDSKHSDVMAVYRETDNSGYGYRSKPLREEVKMFIDEKNHFEKAIVFLLTDLPLSIRFGNNPDYKRLTQEAYTVLRDFKKNHSLKFQVTAMTYPFINELDFDKLIEEKK